MTRRAHQPDGAPVGAALLAATIAVAPQYRRELQEIYESSAARLAGHIIPADAYAAILHAASDALTAELARWDAKGCLPRDRFTSFRRGVVERLRDSA